MNGTPDVAAIARRGEVVLYQLKDRLRLAGGAGCQLRRMRRLWPSLGQFATQHNNLVFKLPPHFGRR
jgi:hypothetical protein